QVREPEPAVLVGGHRATARAAQRHPCARERSAHEVVVCDAGQRGAAGHLCLCHTREEDDEEQWKDHAGTGAVGGGARFGAPGVRAGAEMVQIYLVSTWIAP